MTYQNTVNMRTLERCLSEGFDREKSDYVDTVEFRIRNAILTLFDSFVAPEIELAVSSTSASSGHDATSVTAISERREHIGITAPFEKVSQKNTTLHVLSRNDETRNNIPDQVSELWVPGKHFDWQPHTHHMVTGKTAQIHKIPAFLTGPILKPRNPLSQQHQNSSTQISKDKSLPMIEHTPRKQNSDSNSSINRLFEITAENATQQRPKAAIMLKTMYP